MTYEELKIKLDIFDPIDVLFSVGRVYDDYRWFIVCDDGDCHLFKNDGTEDNIMKVDSISTNLIPHGIKKIVIPDSVTNIGWYTFADCSGLTNVTIGNGVTSIESRAFRGCSGLTRVMIPDSVTSIGDFAFYNCGGLTKVTISDSITSIGYWAFCNGVKLKSVVFKGKTRNEVKAMINYPWGIYDESVIMCY